ncbi:MAG: peptidoglycan DD-metalloendopeptidase family protein [Sandaracinaceae bacterium]
MNGAPTSRICRRLSFVIATLALGAGCDASGGSMEVDAADATDAGVLTRDDGGAPPIDAGASTNDAGPMTAPDAGPPPPACPRVRVVTPGEVLNIRPSPSTAMAVIGTLPDGAIVEVVSMVHGESIGGVDLWYEIRSSAGNGFVFSGFASCTEDEIPVPTGYFVPFACGAGVRVTQSPGGGTSHTGRAMYAYDFGVALNTEIRAMRPGTVTYVFTGTGPGDPCYNGGGPDCGSAANLVIIQHDDGDTSAYKHINSATVSVGTVVRQGDVIARSGSTGYSTGPHLHAEVRSGCPTTVYCNTIPFTFTDVGSPAAGTTVTSGNCP